MERITLNAGLIAIPVRLHVGVSSALVLVGNWVLTRTGMDKGARVIVGVCCQAKFPLARWLVPVVEFFVPLV